MATLNSIRNVVGNFGAHSSTIPTLTFDTNTSFVINNFSAADLRLLSVGDVLQVTAGGATPSYAVGQLLKIVLIDYSLGNVQVDVTAADSEVGLTATLVGWDTDKVPSAGGITNSSAYTDIITKEWDAVTINAGVSKDLVNYTEVGDPTECTILFILDSVTTTADVASTGIFNLVLTDGATEVPLTTLRAGDVFQSSQFSFTYYDSVAPGAVTASTLALKNTTGANLKPSFRLVLGSKA